MITEYNQNVSRYGDENGVRLMGVISPSNVVCVSEPETKREREGKVGTW